MIHTSDLIILSTVAGTLVYLSLHAIKSIEGDMLKANERDERTLDTRSVKSIKGSTKR